MSETTFNFSKALRVFTFFTTYKIYQHLDFFFKFKKTLYINKWKYRERINDSSLITYSIFLPDSW